MDFLLLQINDALFPIGSYTHSFGLESYVQLERITTKQEVQDYLKAYLNTQILYTDLLAIKLIHEIDSLQEILILEETIHAASAANELRNANRKLGARFVKTINAMQLERKELFEQYIQTSQLHIYVVAYGVFCKAYTLNYQHCIQQYLYAQASNTLTNCVKLIPLAQSCGQEILASLHNEFIAISKKLENLQRRDFCNVAIHYEIKAMQHENLYSRLYMS
ncbi:urease accessory protein UreF [Helicobacter aurati]|uniref:Urease accessory protein UreF n=1 Tax=Helicobacter aurati TaxID=137778 RepID=A0A3D8J5Z5_9HELI|nr:urease accessory UreF family protein [Helicobacter aurati]RDU72680.1 urease accessory protein UreF [Helicobacter aurati]